MEKKYVFICGLHRSGTSTIRNIISCSNLVSTHSNTKKPEDEGQHIQSIYDNAKKHGGPGKFGFSKEYHYTEESSLLTNRNNKKLIDEWYKYWDLSKKILVEKSPPNIIHTRYLQEIFSNSYFIIILRHPYVVASACKKRFNKQSIDKHIEHWLYVHEILYNDLKKINNYLVLKYEDLNSNNFERNINNFLEEELNIDSTRIKEINLLQKSNTKYLKNDIPDEIKEKYEEKINNYGYSFNSPFIL